MPEITPQLSALLYHRHRHRPHLGGVASGPLGDRCKTCLCARAEAPRIDVSILSRRKRVLCSSEAVAEPWRGAKPLRHDQCFYRAYLNSGAAFS